METRFTWGFEINPSRHVTVVPLALKGDDHYPYCAQCKKTIEGGEEHPTELLDHEAFTFGLLLHFCSADCFHQHMVLHETRDRYDMELIFGMMEQTLRTLSTHRSEGLDVFVFPDEGLGERFGCGFAYELENIYITRLKKIEEEVYRPYCEICETSIAHPQEVPIISLSVAPGTLHFYVHLCSEECRAEYVSRTETGSEYRNWIVMHMYEWALWALMTGSVQKDSR